MRMRRCHRPAWTCDGGLVPSPLRATLPWALRARRSAPSFIAAHREVDVQRVELVDGGEQGGVALADQRAFGDLLACPRGR